MNKEELKIMSIVDLCKKLSEVEIEIQQKEIEFNQITYELWERIPSLKDDINMQPKVLKKENK